MKTLLLLILVALVMLPTMAKAVDIGTEMAGSIATGSGYEQADSLSLSQQIGKYIRVALSLTGTIFLVLTVYAGFLWMTASGNEDQVTEAKGIITRASIGLLITLAAFSITAFVMAMTGASTSTNKTVGGSGSGGCTEGFWTCWVQGFTQSAKNNPLGKKL